MIRIESLRKDYKNVQALKGVTLHVPEGELFAYLGPNGAGKTTTIRILTGLTRLTGGAAFLNGFHIEKETLAAKRQFGLVPQSANLDQELTVFENLDVHGRLFHMPREERRRKIDELLGYIDLLDRKRTPAKQLSGGMKRRIMIARALVHSPRILFLDEPTVGLDAGIRRRIWALIKKIQQGGTTIFLTTHYIEEAEFLADRVAFLDEGAIVAIDTPPRLISRIGVWAVDRVREGEMETRYFNTREAAKNHVAHQEDSFSLRRVNLEDAFLALTGKKVK
ncbi:ABC transporter ATP-binding protein [Desulfococcus multivorans]|jgi:ABC-2 type transport system ATP-binding protein|uniref:ABC transporter related protein n=1 Tax=Desulfococcus multivorans DSM 2059 TaxID=1121405 RepID=S7UUK4_DESML|nr:ABC transporter ATP-binding protein [Desulfococcus multivorans]AOY58713.1 putative ABC transporter, ATP-binding protein [Desulfococcus multivorans]AQV00998.1 ABC transporter [Desulfococcus multivorans]EPR37734.1 ABC transporter related protein [Desulfococcus multivorans DSM 2059]MDX9817921.1 ABC transporter ATP-binding protein [Desulfococcus multivorans]SJZ46949.1 ABC-2 type transport system ATP-binding protein [Desulfococcus multivorans DSM 2059]